MLRDIGFRADLRRTLEVIPLPSGDRWVPAHKQRDHTTLLVAGSAVLVGATLAGALAAAVARSGGVGAPSAPQVTPPARPTVVGDHHIAPLPKIYRSPELGYNVLAPAWFRRVVVPVPDAEARAGLLSREVLSARSEPVTKPAAWDLVIEVWQRPGSDMVEIAESVGCDRPCVVADTTLQWAGPAWVATLSDPPGKIYLIDRGATILVIRYTIGDEEARPADVTEESLDKIARQIGLV